MGAEQQTVWLHAAVDALEDIRPNEVAAISAELRRSVTRPAQIVPEIARLVSDKRRRAYAQPVEESPFAKELAISNAARKRRADARNQREVEEAYEWERNERRAAGLHVSQEPRPLSREELDSMPAHIAEMGIKCGFLRRESGRLVEVA